MPYPVAAVRGKNFGGVVLFNISGTVYASDGTTPVESATIALGAYSTTSAANGTYTLSGLPPGTSGSMTCTKGGSTWTAKTISAMSGNLTGQNFRAWATLTLQPAEAAATDTYVRESSADTNYALAANFAIQGTANQRRNILLKWDLSSIAVGSTIKSATLYMTNDACSATGVVTASRILAANSAWTEAGATWNYAVASTTRWAGDTGGDGGADAGCSVSGTDYSGTPMGTFTMTAGDPDPTEYTATLNVAEFTTMWGANYGMILTTNANNTNNLHSAGVATASYRPKLVVVYDNP